jgi:hypothetical protein
LLDKRFLCVWTSLCEAEAWVEGAFKTLACVLAYLGYSGILDGTFWVLCKATSDKLGPALRDSRQFDFKTAAGNAGGAIASFVNKYHEDSSALPSLLVPGIEDLHISMVKSWVDWIVCPLKLYRSECTATFERTLIINNDVFQALEPTCLFLPMFTGGVMGLSPACMLALKEDHNLHCAKDLA